MQPLMTSEPTHVGDYRLLARLGSGSMGAVYLARSRGGRFVAVKLVRPELADDAEFRERFRREVQMARSVGGFWTATVVDADPDTEQPWLATEYVPGPTLHRAVVDHGPLPEQSVRTLGAGLAEALGAIHRGGLVHRDLKPANVLLGTDGPRVIDFGISRAMTAQALTATGVFLGTPGFFSPEQTVGNNVGPPSDVFSLGAVLVFAATGVGPFGDENSAVMLYRVVHAEADLTAVPERLRPLLSACLAKEPEARPTTATLLDQIGETSPRGHQWLPSSITAVISEHSTQLQQKSQAADEMRVPAEEPGPPPVDGKRPQTRAYTSMEAVADQAPPVPNGQAAPAASAPVAEPAPAPAPEGRNKEIRPARPRTTSQQPLAPLVRKDNPGPVFATGRRVSSLVSAILLGLIVFGAFQLARWFGAQQETLIVFRLGVALLTLSAALSLAKALLPPLRLKINSDGILLSRASLRRQIPWTRVSKVGLVGRGKKQAMAVWFTSGTELPKSTLWHRVGKYHGGARLFPLGATGGWWTRRQELKRLRIALQQYAPGCYDSRLL